MSDNRNVYFNAIPNAPKAIGPYSPAVKAGEFYFLSGQIAIDPKTSQLVEGGIEKQAEQVLNNIQAILKELGLDFSSLVKSTIFLRDLADYMSVNQIYEKRLEGAKPARSTFQVAGLPQNALIEIEVIARKSN